MEKYIRLVKIFEILDKFYIYKIRIKFHLIALVFPLLEAFKVETTLCNDVRKNAIMRLFSINTFLIRFIEVVRLLDTLKLHLLDFCASVTTGLEFYDT